MLALLCFFSFLPFALLFALGDFLRGLDFCFVAVLAYEAPCIVVDFVHIYRKRPPL